jgi:hypothetical protein
MHKRLRIYKISDVHTILKRLEQSLGYAKVLTYSSKTLIFREVVDRGIKPRTMYRIDKETIAKTTRSSESHKNLYPCYYSQKHVRDL